jgi:hypothetical protein
VVVAAEKRYWLGHHFCSTPREPCLIKFKFIERVVRRTRAGAAEALAHCCRCSSIWILEANIR